MKISTLRTSKIEVSHKRGCIFQGFQHLGKSMENDSKMSPKMTPESMKKWSRSLPGRGSQKKQQKDDIFYEKCPKNDPGGTPKWSQNPSQIILLTGSRPPGSNFWSQGCPGGGYPPKIDSKIIKNWSKIVKNNGKIKNNMVDHAWAWTLWLQSCPLAAAV